MISIPVRKDLAVCRAKLPAFWRASRAALRQCAAQCRVRAVERAARQARAASLECLLAELLAVVRETNPTRIVVVGPTSWNSLAELADVQLPARSATCS